MRSAALTDEALSAPVNVTWEITEACNLTCRHCLSAGLRAERRGELSSAQCRRIIDQLAAADVFQINFGGGEPFLRADFLDLLVYAQHQGITTCVSTNGTVLDDELVACLAAMRGLYLQVSLDGATSETNDTIRGQGTFSRILEGVECLRRHDVRDFSLNMVVTRVNMHEISEFADLCARLGAKPRLSRFRPSGAGCASWDDYRLTRRQLLDLSRFLGEHTDILTGDSFFSLTPESRRRLGLTMCGAARMTMAIAPDGSIYPCAFLTDPAFLAGNAATESPVAVFRRSEVFARLRANDNSACSKCSRFSMCHGGCPAVAYFVARSLDAGDPECLMSALGASA